MNLKLKRPLIFFDLETTGTNILKDRIVEISIIKVNPDGTELEKTRRINPEMHIPEESSQIHGITDDDVKNEPTFSQIAKSLIQIFDDCDIAGFNSNKFDLPLLIEEFSRAGLKFSLLNRKLVDVQNIFHKKEPRNLVAAYQFYCGKDLKDAHSANADTRATYEVLKGQLDKYTDLENDIDMLSQFSGGDKIVDLAGRIVRGADGEPVFNFGKHKGKKVKDVFKSERSFYNWMMQGEFSKNTKDIITALYYEVYPPVNK